MPYLDAVLWLVLVIPGLGTMWLATWRARRRGEAGRHRAPAQAGSQPVVPGWDEQTLAP